MTCVGCELNLNKAIIKIIRIYVEREKVGDKANVAKHYLGEGYSEVCCAILTSLLSLKLFQNKKLIFKERETFTHLPVFHG